MSARRVAACARQRGFSLRMVLVGALVVALSTAGYLHWRSEQFRMPPAAAETAVPDFHLVDFDGRRHSLADYRGKVVVVFFGFTHCPDACPTELFKLSQAMKQLGEARQRVQVLFVSLDPERDTPEILRKYVRAFDPDFIGLTGTMAQIYDATRSFGVMHVKLPIGSDYTIDHSVETHVIDAGQQRWLIGPATLSVGDLVHDLRLLLREKPGIGTE